MWHALIYLLMVSDINLCEVPAYASQEAWWAMKDVADELELFSRDGSWTNDFGSELRWCQDWYQRLKDAPPRADSNWLPPRDYIFGQIALNRNYYEYLYMRHVLYPDDWRIQEAIDETERLHRIWNNASSAAYTETSWYTRRYCMKQIRDDIGLEAYYKGQLPSAVPIKYFSIIRY